MLAYYYLSSTVISCAIVDIFSYVISAFSEIAMAKKALEYLTSNESTSNNVNVENTIEIRH